MNIIKNKKVILAIKNMVFVAGLLFIYLNLSSLFELKDSKIKYTPFIEQTQDFDVLFFWYQPCQMRVSAHGDVG